MAESPDDIVGHKTFQEGPMSFRHEPLTRAEANAIWKAAEDEKEKRAKDMPTERDAIQALWSAQRRLKELGWEDGFYAPKDGTHFQVIEIGSTGIFDCSHYGEWPRGTWTTYDKRDAYPSSSAPALFKLYPEDQAKRDAKMAAERAAYASKETSNGQAHDEMPETER